jgi:hypothetical protein
MSLEKCLFASKGGGGTAGFNRALVVIGVWYEGIIGGLGGGRS